MELHKSCVITLFVERVQFIRNLVYVVLLEDSGNLLLFNVQNVVLARGCFFQKLFELFTNNIRHIQYTLATLALLAEYALPS